MITNFFFNFSRQLFDRLAEEMEKREIPYEQDGTEKNGAEPVLLGRIDYADETLPLKPDSKEKSS